MRTTGLKDFFKWRFTPAPRTNGRYYAPTMNGGVPFYSDFGSNIYASDIIVQSIRCKANEFKKLDPRHIRIVDGLQTLITDSSIARVLKRPNPYMSMVDFLEKITILLELNKNVYIYPAYYITKGGERYYTGLYPLKPSQVWYLTDASEKYYIKMAFANGYEVILPADSVIHWRKDFYDDYFGGNSAFNDTKGLLKMLQRYDQLTQSIAKALDCSCQINGMLKVSSYLSDDEDFDKQREEFEKRLRKSQSGIIVGDLKSEYVHMPRDIKLVDAETLDFFLMAVLRANGTSKAILNGDYNKAQKEAYYEHALEGDIKALGQAFSRVIFSDREASFGNEIVLYPHAITFMSMENKITALQAVLPAGLLLKDEGRELLGYPPLPNGQGQVVAQGYNSLLDENNNNKLGSSTDAQQE